MSEAADTQDEVFAFLADPRTHGGQKVTRIDTHAASVFLAGDRALKVKRAVRFPFLDYSTLAKRKAACEAELAVNAPYAPEIYRGVVAISREASGKLAIDGSGVPIEWAVDMRRFDETRTLDHIVGEIDQALADELGRAVAAAHAKAPPVEAEAWIAALGSYIDEHAETFARLPGHFSRRRNRGAGARQPRMPIERIVPLLRERARQGFVRRIHGDLHLGNIVLIDGKPVLFDAIEFSDVIASGDVLYDLAFLLMDLLERGLAPAANVVLNRYLAQTRRVEDLDALAALPFFLSMRAAIRARVTRATDGARGSAQAGDDRAHGARLFRLRGTRHRTARAAYSSRSAACPAPGNPNSRGCWRPNVEPMPGAVIVRSDVERKALFGVGETEKLPADAYTDAVTARVYAALADKARRVVAAGHSVIVDAVFAQAARARGHRRSGADRRNCPCGGCSSPPTWRPGSAASARRRHDASDADAAVAQAQEGYDLGTLDWTPVDASGTPEATLARAKAALGDALD